MIAMISNLLPPSSTTRAVAHRLRRWPTQRRERTDCRRPAAATKTAGLLQIQGLFKPDRGRFMTGAERPIHEGLHRSLNGRFYWIAGNQIVVEPFKHGNR